MERDAGKSRGEFTAPAVHNLTAHAVAPMAVKHVVFQPGKLVPKSPRSSVGRAQSQLLGTLWTSARPPLLWNSYAKHLGRVVDLRQDVTCVQMQRKQASIP